MSKNETQKMNMKQKYEILAEDLIILIWLKQ